MPTIEQDGKKVQVLDLDQAQINPAEEDGAIGELRRLMTAFLQSPMGKAALAPTGHLRVSMEGSVAGPSSAVNASQTGTWNLGNLTGVFPINQQFELTDRARHAYAVGVRANLAFS